MERTDVAIIGGGLIGCASAYYLTRAGLKVTVLDQGRLGSEASWAGAGMLGAQVELAEPTPAVSLAIPSRAMYPDLAKTLREETGIDIGYQAGGIMLVALTEADAEQYQARLRWQVGQGLRAEWLTPGETRELEPELKGDFLGALHLPDDHQVSSPLVAQALAAAARRRGAILREGARVHGFLTEGSRVIGVRTATGDLVAEWVVLAAGAWSGALAAKIGLDLPVRPVKGQMLALRMPWLPAGRTIFSSGCYLLPKCDGRILVGASMEEVGFDKRPTLGVLNGMAEAATRLIPALREASFESAWAGLRPGNPDDLPFIGLVEGRPGLIVATGHFRKGILMAPITGRIVEALVTGAKPPVDLRPFDPARRFDARSGL